MLVCHTLASCCCLLGAIGRYRKEMVSVDDNDELLIWGVILLRYLGGSRNWPAAPRDFARCCSSGATLVYSVSVTTMVNFEFERSFISIYLGGSGCVSGVAAATQQSGRKRLEILL